MGWRRSGREREEGEEARAGRAEGWKEGPEEEPGRRKARAGLGARWGGVPGEGAAASPRALSPPSLASSPPSFPSQQRPHPASGCLIQKQNVRHLPRQSRPSRYGLGPPVPSLHRLSILVPLSATPRPPLTAPRPLAFGAWHPSPSRRATQDRHGRRQKGISSSGWRTRSLFPPAAPPLACLP